MGVIPGLPPEQDIGTDTDMAPQSEPVAEWRSFIPELVASDTSEIPHPGAVLMKDEGRNPTAHPDVVTYLQGLYGTDVEVALAGRFRKEDGSGISYGVYRRRADDLDHLADFRAVNLPITLLPDYQGRLRAGYDAVQERNRKKSKSERMEDFRATVWKLDESPTAAEARIARTAPITPMRWKGDFEPLTTKAE